MLFRSGIEARKEILKSCELIRPFIPNEIEGQPWGSYDTDVIATNKKFFMFEPDANWHKFEGYGEGNKWGVLGGVRDADRDTYIIAEDHAGDDNDELKEFTEVEVQIHKYYEPNIE